jgi:tricarballylate dehydrogenase
MTEAYDVVVIGAGNAAMAAAMSAHEEGVSIVVLEKAPEEFRGGNTRFAGGLFRVSFRDRKEIDKVVGKNGNPADVNMPIYSNEDYRNDILRISGGQSDMELVDFMIENSLEAVQWMSDIGINLGFNELSALKKDAEGRTDVPKGGPVRSMHDGIGLSKDWFDVVDKAGIPVLYETMALDFVRDDAGKVTGVLVRGPEGERVIDCKATVVANGGFSSSPAMRTAYLGQDWCNVKVRGTRYNTGEILRAAMDRGAEAYGDWAGCHATPIDFDAPQYGDFELTDKSNRLSYPFSVMVNINGERFVNEGEDIKFNTYAKTGRAILNQPMRIGFQVFDQQNLDYLEPRYSTGTPTTADTFEELADKLIERFAPLQLNKENFLKTLYEYNDAVVGGEEFIPDIKDGNTTQGLALEKTNWARKLEKPPYVCYAATCGLTFTFGGVKTNLEAEIIDINGKRIEGMYGAGEVQGGFFYNNYPAGSGLTRGTVYGRVAGTNAAKFAQRNV